MIHFVNLLMITILILAHTPAHGKAYAHKVLRVIDGDTVEIEALYLPDDLQKKLSVRVLGVDTPEKGHLSRCSKENELSIQAKDFTHSKIAGAKEVLIDIKKWDKYGGRVLGYVYIDGKSLSELLIENNYAVPYTGNKKTKDWCK